VANQLITVKQNLAALRILFDWLVMGHVLDVNPAHPVHGPKWVLKRDKRPLLAADEARELILRTFGHVVGPVATTYGPLPKLWQGFHFLRDGGLLHTLIAGIE